MSTELVAREQQAVATQQDGGDQVLAIIAAAARDPAVDPAKMTALVELKERIDAKGAEIAFNQDFAAMQQRLPRVRRNGSIDLARGKPIPFAKWEDVDRVIRPILAEFHFTMSFPTRTENGKLIMACVLRHAAGHSERSEAEVLPDSGPGRNSSQAIGSGRSYTKRYLALDTLNVVTEGVDDDGRASGFISPEQADTIRDMIAECEMDQARQKKFLEFAGAPRIEHIQKFDFERVIVKLRDAVRKKQGAA